MQYNNSGVWASTNIQYQYPQLVHSGYHTNREIVIICNKAMNFTLRNEKLECDGMRNNKSLVNKKPFSECLNKQNTWPLQYSRPVFLCDKVYTSK
jgi:hypothetical protein